MIYKCFEVRFPVGDTGCRAKSCLSADIAAGRSQLLTGLSQAHIGQGYITCYTIRDDCGLAGASAFGSLIWTAAHLFIEDFPRIFTKSEP